MDQMKAMKLALEALECALSDEPYFVKAGLATITLRQAISEAEQAQPAAQIHCPEKRKPGGCQLHNLHCGWPKCNEPPPRQPLTDEEIDRVTDAQWASNNHKPIYASHRAYARAIEAKIKENT